MNVLVRILTACAGLLASAAALAQAPAVEAFINAPLTEVWASFTTPDGLTRLGARTARADLRVGGEIQVSYSPDPAQSDRVATMVQEILAYEPQRMLALRERPANAARGSETHALWRVVYFTASGNDMTHVRIVSLSDSATTQAEAAREADQAHSRLMLDRLAKHYWPQCALCKAEGGED